MKKPLIIGITGSVGVGKTTFAATLSRLILEDERVAEIYCGKDFRKENAHPKIVTVSTDNFLFPNTVLAQKGLTNRKGFPESYDNYALSEFLLSLKSGFSASMPVYNQDVYDIVVGATETVSNPDVVILDGVALANVRELVDVLLFLEASPLDTYRWYFDRCWQSIEKSKSLPKSWFAQFINTPEDEVNVLIKSAWDKINEPIYYETVVPLKASADFLIKFNQYHEVVQVVPNREIRQNLNQSLGQSLNQSLGAK